MSGNSVLAKMAVEISANNSQFIKKTEESAKAANNFASRFSGVSKSAKEFSNNVNIAGQNLGSLVGGFTALLNPATLAAGAISGIGAAYLTTRDGAEALEAVQFRLSSSFEILGREVSVLVDIFDNEFSKEGQNKIIGFFNGINEALDITNISIAIGKMLEDGKALADLKGIYDDLLRDRIIESQTVSELDRQIEKLKTLRVEENVTTQDKIALDKQILKLEEDRFLLLISDAERRRQALELEADQIAGVTGLLSEEERQQKINNELTDEQLKLLIDTRNEIKNLEAEYFLRIRKIRKELTGLMDDFKRSTDTKVLQEFAPAPKLEGGDFLSNYQLNIKSTSEQIKELSKQYRDSSKDIDLWAGSAVISHGLVLDAQQQQVDMLLGMTAAAEQFATSLISGQQGFLQALGNFTLDIIDLYLKQALAAAIAKSLANPSVPLPIGLAAAAASVGVIRSLFAKSVGSTGGGGGGGSAVSPINDKASRSVTTHGEQIQLSGTIEVQGEKLLVVMKNAEDKRAVRRG